MTIRATHAIGFFKVEVIDLFGDRPPSMEETEPTQPASKKRGRPREYPDARAMSHPGVNKADVIYRPTSILIHVLYNCVFAGSSAKLSSILKDDITINVVHCHAYCVLCTEAPL